MSSFSQIFLPHRSSLSFLKHLVQTGRIRLHVGQKSRVCVGMRLRRLRTGVDRLRVIRVIDWPSPSAASRLLLLWFHLLGKRECETTSSSNIQGVAGVQTCDCRGSDTLLPIDSDCASLFGGCGCKMAGAGWNTTFRVFSRPCELARSLAASHVRSFNFVQH